MIAALLHLEVGADAGRRRLASGAADHLAFESIEPAAEGDDVDGRHRRHPASSAASKLPSKARVAGPVINTCPSSRQRMSRSPPSSATIAWRPVSPRRWAA